MLKKRYNEKLWYFTACYGELLPFAGKRPVSYTHLTLPTIA